MLTVMVVLVYSLAVLLDFIPHLKDRTGKGNTIYCALLAVSFCVLLLYSFNIQVPGPSEPIKSFIEKYIMPPQ